MQYNIVLAGVGGQGILTIAKAISLAALKRGLQVKQAEVHGMSQREGAVYSHVRISDREIFSDLIPAGQADMILSIEPLEALRYKPMLRSEGVVVTGTSAVANISSYPQVEKVLDHVSGFHHHVGLDMNRLGRAAGSTLAANIAALGAASHYLPFSVAEMEDALKLQFGAKGERVVDSNLRAFRFGRNAAAAYLAGLERGIKPSELRQWIDTVPAESLADDELAGQTPGDTMELTSGEASAFESVLLEAYDEDRRHLYEHEVYSLIELVGAISAPRHRFIPKGSTIDEAGLNMFTGRKLVLKVVSQDIVHKSDVGAVRFVPRELGAVRKEIGEMIARFSEMGRVAGVLAVEFVEHDERGMGGELFVGIRATREFGPVIAAGLGGTDTEYLASQMRPGRAVAKALALECDAEAFLDLFRATVAYDVLSGSVRGQGRVVSDSELLRCFRAFIGIARKFCVDRGEEGPDIGELEVNPFAFRDERLLPLDGRGTLRPAAKRGPSRDLDNVRAMLEPKSIAVAGVSSRPGSLGRVILGQILAAGFPASNLTVVKDGEAEFEGISCSSSLEALADPADMLVITAPAAGAVDLVASASSLGKARAGVIISGGAGETESSSDLGESLKQAMHSQRNGNGAVFLGPNCMGVRSLPGKFDTFFVPENKMPSRVGRRPDPVAILSQSGAFAVSRMSRLDQLNPVFTVSFGNQFDVTLSDLLKVLRDRDVVQVAAIYMEGFADLDGLDAVHEVREWTRSGKTVLLYKAGRTPTGRTAAAGHTAAVAGDYDICLSAFAASGAIVTANLDEFNHLLEMCTLLADFQPQGQHIFAITNAGMEAVAIADTLGEPDSQGFLAGLGRGLFEDITSALAAAKLDALVSPRNPLDLTPMADERTYDRMVRLALECPTIDAVLVSCVPLAPVLHTLADDLDDSCSFVPLAREWKKARKPVVFVLDGGDLYAPLARRLREEGLPVFRSADAAVRALAMWLGSKVSSLSMRS